MYAKIENFKSLLAQALAKTFLRDKCAVLYIASMEQMFLYVCTAGSLAGIVALLFVLVNNAEYKRDHHLDALITRIQAMQTGFDSQLNSWKGLWEASTQEIRELKMEIKELRVENDKLA